MSIVAQGVFADRIAQYVEQNPNATAPEVMGRFLVEPTDEQQAFVEDILAADGGDASHDTGDNESEVAA
jgi:hypothetical protein